jgi:hypothetical protein
MASADEVEKGLVSNYAVAPGHNRAKARGDADAIKRFAQRFRETALNTTLTV